MCYEDQTIEVPKSCVATMKAQGAICGGCDERCCGDQPGEKIDMCLNGNTINVSRNACPGIKTAGGTCGACPVPDPEPEPEAASKTVRAKVK